MQDIASGVQSGLGLELGDLYSSRDLTAADVVAMCTAQGADRAKAESVIDGIRDEYFTKKYLEYTYELDLRGLSPGWEREPLRLLADRHAPPSRSTVLAVGVGNGLELPYLYEEVQELIAVDISQRMLTAAEERFSNAKYVCNTAENLVDIKASSVDSYVSLRTYQSSLFGIRDAFREAYRVLKPTGVFVVSIANGYVDVIDGKKQIVRGLQIPGTRTVVDRDTPFRIAKGILQLLEDYGFQDLDFHEGQTDLYAAGVKP